MQHIERSFSQWFIWLFLSQKIITQNTSHCGRPSGAILAFKNVSTYSYAPQMVKLYGDTLRKCLWCLKNQPARVHVTMQLSSENKQQFLLTAKSRTHSAVSIVCKSLETALLNKVRTVHVCRRLSILMGCFNHWKCRRPRRSRKM